MATSALLQSNQLRIRLDYLDGVRGLTALYVVVFHVFQECYAKHDFPSFLVWLTKPSAYAEAAVSVFIVLSGYCLMLPVVRAQQGFIPGGVLQYLRRRSHRILPPYYAALAFTLLFLLVTNTIQCWFGVMWDSSAMGFQPGVIPSLGALLSHVFLVQNWHLDWAYKINGPMWTMATEWQIYFLFPFLLLPIYRRFGMLAVVVFSFVIGLGSHYIWPWWPDYTVSPWFLGLFALGMAAAVINFSHRLHIIRWRQRIPWKAVSLALLLVVIAIFAPQPAPMGPSKLLSCLVGLTAATFLIYCTKKLTDSNMGHTSRILRLFEHPWVVKLGLFSFSIYLTHAPIVVMVHQILLYMKLAPAIVYMATLTISVPLAIIFGYRFYIKFEQPFMSHYAKSCS